MKPEDTQAQICPCMVQQRARSLGEPGRISHSDRMATLHQRNRIHFGTVLFKAIGNGQRPRRVKPPGRDQPLMLGQKPVLRSISLLFSRTAPDVQPSLRRSKISRLYDLSAMLSVFRLASARGVPRYVIGPRRCQRYRAPKVPGSKYLRPRNESEAVRLGA